MRFQELLKGGVPDLDAILKDLQGQIRAKPGDPKLRIFLFQLLCVMEDWERAGKQLDTLATLSKEQELFAKLHIPLLESERFRSEVFSGKRTPLIFGEPEEWLASVVKALAQYAEGHIDAAKELTLQAFDQAKSVSGTIDGEPFEWLADADQRLGPVIELITGGKYYWLPLSRVSAIAFDPPEELRDMVWIGAQLKLTNGLELGAMVPVRYPARPGAARDSLLLLARKTQWADQGSEVFFGEGQRLFATDKGDHAILDIRRILFSQPTP